MMKLLLVVSQNKTKQNKNVLLGFFLIKDKKNKIFLISFYCNTLLSLSRIRIKNNVFDLYRSLKRTLSLIMDIE